MELSIVGFPGDNFPLSSLIAKGLNLKQGEKGDFQPSNTWFVDVKKLEMGETFGSSRGC